LARKDDVDISDTPTLPWLIACIALCLVLIVYRFASHKEMPANLGFQVGYNLPGALVFAGLLYAAFRKKVSVQVGWLGFGLVFASMIGATVVTANRQKVEMRKVAAEMRTSLDTVKSSLESGAGNGSIPLTSAAQGDAGKMAVIVKTMLNRMLAQRRAYEQELDGAGWSKVLDPARIDQDKYLDETRTILRQAREVMKKYEDKTDELFVQMRADVEKADINAEMKESMVAGFNKSEAKSKSNAMVIWKLEGQALDQVSNAVTLLGNARAHWQIEGGQFAFQRQADLDQYNAYMAKLQEIAAKQEAIQNSAMQKAQDRMQQIGK
jgi:hypothetical protein